MRRWALLLSLLLIMQGATQCNGDRNFGERSSCKYREWHDQFTGYVRPEKVDLDCDNRFPVEP